MSGLSISLMENVQIEFVVSQHNISFTTKELGPIARRDVGETVGEIVTNYIHFNVPMGCNMISYDVNNYKIHIQNIGFIGDPIPHVSKVIDFLTVSFIQQLWKCGCKSMIVII